MKNCSWRADKEARVAAAEGEKAAPAEGESGSMEAEGTA